MKTDSPVPGPVYDLLSKALAGAEPPLTPDFRQQLRDHLETLFLDFDKMNDHICWLQRNHQELNKPFPEEGELAEPEMEAIIDQGLDALGDAKLVRLLLDGATMMTLADKLLENVPEAWLVATRRQAAEFSRIHGLTTPPFEEMIGRTRKAAARVVLPTGPSRFAPARIVAWVAGVAALFILIAFGFWRHTNLVGAERAKAEAAQQAAAEAKDRLQELEKAGYLDPFGVDIVIGSPTRLVVAGWVHPGVIERVEVMWDNAPGTQPEILYQSQGQDSDRLLRVTFPSKARTYELDRAATVKPKVRAIPFKDAKPILDRIHNDNPPLEVKASFTYSPTDGLEPEEASEPFSSDAQAARWVLRQGGYLIVRDKQQGKATTVHTLDDLPKEDTFVVSVIGLRNATDTVTDRDFRRLSNLGAIDELDAARTNLTDAGLEHIKKMTSLKKLYLTGCKVTDEGLNGVQVLENLSYLNLGNTRVIGPGLKSVGELRNLRWLSLEGTEIADKGLVHLTGLKDLSHLNVRGTRLTNAGLNHLAGIKSLEQLILMETKVTDAGLDHLKGLSRLKYLDLARTDVTDAGAKRLRSQVGDQCVIKVGRDGKPI